MEPNDDERFMRLALERARQGLGAVEPNPLVGALLVRNQQILALGHHEQFGGPHAEVNALASIQESINDATLYVTLEPCCHQGKTPPCTDLLLARKPKRVVIAMTDPFPAVKGEGIARLQAAGIDVSVGCLEAEAKELNAPYLKLLTRARPYVHAKWAMSLDGKIATSTGESKWITSDPAREHAHAFRGLMDAIIVGHGTVKADDPLLTARPAGPRVATRVILDSRAEMKVDTKIAQTARDIPTIVATTTIARPASISRLEATGCEVLVFKPTKQGRVPVDALLDKLGTRRWTNVLLEGGGETIGAFLDAREIDSLRVYVAPSLIGGAAAPAPVGGIGFSKIADRLQLVFDPPLPLGRDIFLHAHRQPQPAS